MNAEAKPGAHLHESFRSVLKEPTPERLRFIDHPRWIDLLT